MLLVLTDGNTNEGSKPFSQVLPPLKVIPIINCCRSSCLYNIRTFLFSVVNFHTRSDGGTLICYLVMLYFITRYSGQYGLCI